MNIKVCKHQFQNIKHEMSFKSILQPNPEQKSSIENIHNKSVLHPTPCLEKQSSKVINNIPQVLLLSWVATSLSCPCLHCLNTEWFALDWSLLDGWAAERQHQKIRGKKSKLQQDSLPSALVLQKHKGDFDPQATRAEISFFLEFHHRSQHTNISREKGPSCTVPTEVTVEQCQAHAEVGTSSWMSKRKLNHREPALTHSQHPSRLLEKVCS